MGKTINLCNEMCGMLNDLGDQIYLLLCATENVEALHAAMDNQTYTGDWGHAAFSVYVSLDTIRKDMQRLIDNGWSTLKESERIQQEACNDFVAALNSLNGGQGNASATQ